MQHKMPCPRCEGAGEIPLSDALEDTLASLKEYGPMTAPNLRPLAKGSTLTNTAVNNRLEDLRNLGFVERKRSRRGWTYFLKRNHYRKKS